jgi:vitamin B12 transport system substrate-binding protein
MSAWRSERRWLVTLLLCCGLGTAQAQPRVVTLTPHATEMVYAAGGGDLIVATVESSNFPPEAQQIAHIGDGQNTGLEQVLAQHPDLVIGWPSRLFRQLQQHGIPTYTHTPDSIPALIQDIETLGSKLGTLEYAQRSSEQLRHRLASLPAANRSQPLRVLVMAGPNDDYVIGRDGLINDAITHCGGTNPFASHSLLAPKVNLESMISSKPDLIVTGHPPSQRLRQIATVLEIDADLLYRPGPRFLEAARQLCAAIARQALPR